MELEDRYPDEAAEAAWASQEQEPPVGWCECDWKGCRHPGQRVPAHDHGDVRTSPELCMECLFCCCGERDDEMDDS